MATSNLSNTIPYSNPDEYYVPALQLPEVEGKHYTLDHRHRYVDTVNAPLTGLDDNVGTDGLTSMIYGQEIPPSYEPPLPSNKYPLITQRRQCEIKDDKLTESKTQIKDIETDGFTPEILWYDVLGYKIPMPMHHPYTFQYPAVNYKPDEIEPNEMILSLAYLSIIEIITGKNGCYFAASEAILHREHMWDSQHIHYGEVPSYRMDELKVDYHFNDGIVHSAYPEPRSSYGPASDNVHHIEMGLRNSERISDIFNRLNLDPHDFTKWQYRSEVNLAMAFNNVKLLGNMATTIKNQIDSYQQRQQSKLQKMNYEPMDDFKPIPIRSTHTDEQKERINNHNVYGAKFQAAIGTTMDFPQFTINEIRPNYPIFNRTLSNNEYVGWQVMRIAIEARQQQVVNQLPQLRVWDLNEAIKNPTLHDPDNTSLHYDPSYQQEEIARYAKNGGDNDTKTNTNNTTTKPTTDNDDNDKEMKDLDESEEDEYDDDEYSAYQSDIEFTPHESIGMTKTFSDPIGINRQDFSTFNDIKYYPPWLDIPDVRYNTTPRSNKYFPLYPLDHLGENVPFREQYPEYILQKFVESPTYHTIVALIKALLNWSSDIHSIFMEYYSPITHNEGIIDIIQSVHTIPMDAKSMMMRTRGATISMFQNLSHVKRALKNMTDLWRVAEPNPYNFNPVVFHGSRCLEIGFQNRYDIGIPIVVQTTDLMVSLNPYLSAYTQDDVSHDFADTGVAEEIHNATVLGTISGIGILHIYQEYEDYKIKPKYERLKIIIEIATHFGLFQHVINTRSSNVHRWYNDRTNTIQCTFSFDTNTLVLHEYNHGSAVPYNLNYSYPEHGMIDIYHQNNDRDQCLIHEI